MSKKLEDMEDICFDILELENKECPPDQANPELIFHSEGESEFATLLLEQATIKKGV